MKDLKRKVQETKAKYQYYFGDDNFIKLACQIKFVNAVHEYAKAEIDGYNISDEDFKDMKCDDNALSQMTKLGLSLKI